MPQSPTIDSVTVGAGAGTGAGARTLALVLILLVFFVLFPLFPLFVLFVLLIILTVGNKSASTYFTVLNMRGGNRNLQLVCRHIQASRS